MRGTEYTFFNPKKKKLIKKELHKGTKQMESKRICSSRNNNSIHRPFFLMITACITSQKTFPMSDELTSKAAFNDQRIETVDSNITRSYLKEFSKTDPTCFVQSPQRIEMVTY